MLSCAARSAESVQAGGAARRVRSLLMVPMASLVKSMERIRSVWKQAPLNAARGCSATVALLVRASDRPMPSVAPRIVLSYVPAGEPAAALVMGIPSRSSSTAWRKLTPSARIAQSTTLPPA